MNSDVFTTIGHHGRVARDVESCTYQDSKHAAGVSLGTIQARTNVQLALACQRSMLCAGQATAHRATRVRSQWESECADHAAALRSHGLTSSPNVTARLVRHNFDTSACCDGFHDISEIWKGCITFGQMQRRHLKKGVSAVLHHRVH